MTATEQAMTVQGVIFDAFGTLLSIPNAVHPYRQILREGRRHGRRPQPGDARTLMSCSLELAEAANRLDIKVSYEHLQNIQVQLDEELARIRAYPDAIEAVNLLKEAGIPIGVCSNLAKPYGAVVKRLFPHFDAYGFSYELGCAKPAPEIYVATCRMMRMQLARQPGASKVLMIGDSQRCDCDGPQSVGISGFFLDRSGKTGFSSLTEFAQFVLASHRTNHG